MNFLKEFDSVGDSRISNRLRWSSKSGHKLNLILCSYGKENWKNTASEV